MQAGFAKRDITPEPGVFLAGNGEFRSEGVHDPLFVRALVLADADEWVAVVCADLIGLEFESTLAARRILRESGCGRPEHLLVSCTHTHNGPHTRFGKHTFLPHRDDAYLARVSAAIAAAVMEADARKETVSLTHGRGWACENFNRRMIAPDGATCLYNSRTARENPELAARMHGVTDHELDALQLLRQDGSVLATAVHYAAHPLTVGIFKHVLSADYCGALVRNVEQACGGDALFLQGPCGDLHPKGLFAGFDRMEEMADNLSAETVRVLAHGAPAPAAPRLRFAKKALALPTVISSAQTANAKNTLWNLDLFDAAYRTEMCAFAVGPLAFVSAPGELLCEPGLQIKCNSAFEQTWVLYNCNGYSSYIAHRRAYTEGGYEGDSGQCLAPEACALVVRTADELLQEIMRNA